MIGGILACMDFILFGCVQVGLAATQIRSHRQIIPDNPRYRRWSRTEIALLISRAIMGWPKFDVTSCFCEYCRDELSWFPAGSAGDEPALLDVGSGIAPGSARQSPSSRTVVPMNALWSPGEPCGGADEIGVTL